MVRDSFYRKNWLQKGLFSRFATAILLFEQRGGLDKLLGILQSCLNLQPALGQPDSQMQLELENEFRVSGIGNDGNRCRNFHHTRRKEGS